MALQQYDIYGKIHTIKLQHVCYKERVGIRPGQVHRLVKHPSLYHDYKPYIDVIVKNMFVYLRVVDEVKVTKLGLPLEHQVRLSYST